MTELILRRNKTTPITKIEMDSNFTILSDRIDLSTDQIISGKKTFKLFPIVPEIPSNDSSSKIANKSFLDTLPNPFSNIVLSPSIQGISTIKTFSSGITAPTEITSSMNTNVATKKFFDSVNNKPILSTSLPVNPDNNPLGDTWMVVNAIGNSIDEVYQYINGRWNLPLKIVQYESGYNHHIVKLEDGTVWVSGLNNYGQTEFDGSNRPSYNDFPVFQKISNIYNNPNKIVCAGDISIIERSDGVVEFRGGTGYVSGKYLDSSSDTILPFTFPKIIATNGAFAMYQLSDGKVYVAGADYNMLGVGTGNEHQTLTEVPFLFNARKITIGETIGFLDNNNNWKEGAMIFSEVENGDVYVIGHPNNTSLGLNIFADYLPWTIIPDVNSPRLLLTDGTVSFIQKSDGTLLSLGASDQSGSTFSNQSYLTVFTIIPNFWEEDGPCDIVSLKTLGTKSSITTSNGTSWIAGTYIWDMVYNPNSTLRSDIGNVVKITNASFCSPYPHGYIVNNVYYDFNDLLNHNTLSF
jgi:hypothetical protein